MWFPSLVGRVMPKKTRKHFFAYVTNNGSATVSVIDTVTNTVVATIPVGLAPNGVVLTPDGKFAYVANWSSNTVSVIDTTTKTVVGSPIPIVSAPQGIGITPDGKSVYVTAEPNAVVVIDTATNAIVGPPS